MKYRTALGLTAFVSSILAAVVVYLVLSVPNDLRADALLETARGQINAKKHDEARKSLSTIIQQYPRTDAAAAATIALMSLSQMERDEVVRSITLLRNRSDEQAKQLANVQRSLEQLRSAPPRVVTVTAPAKPAPVAKKAPAKKTTKKSVRKSPKKPVKKSTRRRK